MSWILKLYSVIILGRCDVYCIFAGVRWWLWVGQKLGSWRIVVSLACISTRPSPPPKKTPHLFSWGGEAKVIQKLWGCVLRVILVPVSQADGHEMTLVEYYYLIGMKKDDTVSVFGKRTFWQTLEFSRFRVPTLYFIWASPALHTCLLKKKKAQQLLVFFYRHLVSNHQKFAVVIWK